MTASDSTPGTRKSTGCAKSVETASTFAKNTRMPSGIASVTMRFSPRRSCSVLSARAWAKTARRCTLTSLFCGDLEEHFLEGPAPGLQRGERHVDVPEMTRKVGDAIRRPRGPHNVFAGTIFHYVAVGEGECSPYGDDIEARRGREPDLVRDGVLG